MKAVLLAAGKGTRMQGLCDELPKPLMPVASRPVLVHTIGQLEEAGVSDVLLVVGHQARLVRNGLGRRCGNVRLHYALQEDPRGTGQATALAEDFAAGQPFLMMFGDIVTSRRHLPEIAAIYAEERPSALLSVRYFRDPASGGAVYVEGDRVVRIVERPEPGQTTTHYINAGIFVLPPEIFDLLRQVELSPRGEYELTDAIAMLLEAGRTVRAYELEGFWINVTDPATCLEAQRELFAETGVPGSQVPPHVAVDGPVVVAGSCELGPCRLGPNVSVSEACTVGAGARVRDAIVLAGGTVGQDAIVEGAVVGMNARVEPGARLVGDPGGEAAVLLHGESFPPGCAAPDGRRARGH
ncbi:MAG: sugar phosphate nucleotidyltransferase [Candidatus Brocadiia bacterium]